MAIALSFAAFLAVAVGVAHSYLGERYIISRLLRRDLPKLFGSDTFTKQTIRFAWHLTTVAWCGFAGILLLMALDAVATASVALVLALTFFVSACLTAGYTRGRHLAWIVFLAIAVIAATVFAMGVEA
jgi:hypothetical protein